MTTREPIAGMIVLGTLGAVLCGLALWRDWSPVVWWIGAAIVLLALVVIAWRRGTGRRPLCVAGAAVVGLAVAAVPVVEPVLRPSAEVAWSIEGTEEPIAQASLPANEAATIILTTDDEHMVRARAVEDGTVLWHHQSVEQEDRRAPQVHVAGELVFIPADHLGEPDGELAALDVGTGEKVWSAPGTMTPVVRSDSVLVVHAFAGAHRDVYQGLDLHTGETLWEAEAGESAPGGSTRTALTTVAHSDWLVDTSGTEDDPPMEILHTVTDVATGEQYTFTGTSAHSSAGVVGDHLIVQDSLLEADETIRGGVVPTRVSAYHLPSGDVAWETDLDLAPRAWQYHQNRISPHLRTFDGPRIQGTGTGGGDIEVLDLRDGTSHEYEIPTSYYSRSVAWARDDVALLTSRRLWAVLDLTTDRATPISPPPFSRIGNPIATTVRISGNAVPAWEVEQEGRFGWEYTHLVALDLSTGRFPVLTDLGALPEGAVRGEYADRVVVVESENAGTLTRTTAMHVLAPFD